MEISEQLEAELRRLISADARDRLLAKGLARGIIWKDGIVPEGSPAYGKHLSQNLLHYGFSVLVRALALIELDRHNVIGKSAMRYAAECIESAVRQGEKSDDRGFHLIVSACAFHAAGFAARSFCLLKEEADLLNLSTVEKFFVMLIRKELGSLRFASYRWLADIANSDEGYAAIITGAVNASQYELNDLFVKALNRNYIQALALFDSALRYGDDEQFKAARYKVKCGLDECATETMAHIPMWWIHKLTLILMNDIWNSSLHQIIPVSVEDHKWNDLRKKFIAVQIAKNFSEVSLWPSQIEAASRIMNESDDLILALPTSAGKTKIAEMAILRALATGKRAVYITPLKALSAQIERRLGNVFRPLGFSVSSLYGSAGVTFQDVSTLRTNTITVSTPEKLDFALRQDASLLDDVGVIILDEGHMIGVGSREVRYEVLVQRLLSREDSDIRRLICLSAVFSPSESFDDFTQWLRSDSPGDAIHSLWRPARQRAAFIDWRNEGRLNFFETDDFSEAFVPKFVEAVTTTARISRRTECPNDRVELSILTAVRLIADGHRVLIYCPLKKSVETLGRAVVMLAKQGFILGVPPSPEVIETALAIGVEWLGASHVAMDCLKLGFGLHHGSLPRQFLSQIETLLDRKLIAAVIASPTMAQGVDLTCSAVVFHSIYSSGKPLRAGDYSNVVGRVGRAFVDLDGLVVFPIFKMSARLRRDLVSLRAEGERRIESGIFQLIGRLMEAISLQIGASDSNFAEYVLNESFDWNFESFATHLEPLHGSNAAPLDELVDSLDGAILATVDDLDLPIHKLAEHLDTALKSSLWLRTLAHTSETVQTRQKQLFYARAKWLWSHSDKAMRKGLFSAGIGFTAGMEVENNLPELVAQLLNAEEALRHNSVDEFVAAILTVASILFQTYPYTRRGRDPEWPVALEMWLRGVAVNIFENRPELLECIQDDFIYRLVWAVESVKSFARENGMVEVELLTGKVPLTITYGVPSATAAFLLENGLRSRVASLAILEAYPAEFTTRSGLTKWLDQIGNLPFVEGSAELTIWKDFYDNYKKQDFISPWQNTWRFSVSDSKVAFIPDGDSTIICSSDMSESAKYAFDSRNLAVYDSSFDQDGQVRVSTIRLS